MNQTFLNEENNLLPVSVTFELRQPESLQTELLIK